MIFALAFLIVEILFGCVSQTLPDQRFQDSQSLAAPLSTVAVADPNNFTFAVVGDLHIANQDTTRLSTILTAAAAEGDQFIALLGDIVEDGAAADVQAVQAALSSGGYANKVAPVLGNHDIFNDGWTAYKQVFGPSHYTFTAGNSQFIVIDTGDGSVANSEQAWLQTQLSSGSYTNRFMMSHYLPTVPRFRTYLKIVDDLEALSLMKLAVNAQVTAWLGGHYHSFITGNVAGTTIVVAGGGGRRMPPVLNFFFVQVTVAGNKVTYTMHPVS